MPNQNVNLQSKLLKRLNIFSKMSVKLVFLSLLTILYLFVPVSAASAQNTSTDPAYPVCYFATTDGGDRTWRWGLKTDSSEDWFTLEGDWERSPDTDVWKFKTTSSESDVEGSCENARNVADLDGYNRQAIYAAVNDEGSNYELIYDVKAVDEKAVLIYDKTDIKLAKDAVKAKSGRGIESVKEAVAAAKDLAGGGKINTLNLVGHGASGIIGLGSGTNDVYQPGKELHYDKLNDVSDDLNILKESLANDSYVILWSCYTGKEPNGLNFVKQLSEKLPNSYIFANKECIGLSAKYKKNLVCTVEGDTTWQRSKIVAAKGNAEFYVDREFLRYKLEPRLCVPTK